MTFNPIEQKRNQKYTRVELDAFFKGSFAEAQRVKRENPSLYKEYRDTYEAMGIFAPSLIGTPAPNTPYRPPTKTYTTAELAARGRFSEAEIRAFFNSKESNDVFTSDRNLYELKRESAVSYGLFEPRETPYVPTKPPAPEWTMRISDDLARESNLPIGTVVNSEQLAQLCELKVDRARQAQETAAAKVAADRAVELERLTAAQRLEQAARDRQQADADRLAALLVPLQTPPAEDPGLATARAIAQERAKVAEVVKA